jgi:hypothetical protein
MNLDTSPACDPLKLMHVEHIRPHYCVEVNPNLTLADVTAPSFWRHTNTDNIPVNSLIEVISPTLDALLRVTTSGKGLLTTRVLRVWEEKVAAAKAGKITYLPAGPRKGFRVQAENGEELAHGLTSRAEAEAFLGGSAA